MVTASISSREPEMLTLCTVGMASSSSLRSLARCTRVRSGTSPYSATEIDGMSVNEISVTDGTVASSGRSPATPSSLARISASALSASALTSNSRNTEAWPVDEVEV